MKVCQGPEQRTFDPQFVAFGVNDMEKVARPGLKLVNGGD
jgi:hypothetical protein